jgi:undecaprenyl diphosphate synthase
LINKFNKGANLSLEHIAIIMDGNNRWAQREGLSVSKGHAEGAKAAYEIVKGALQNKIKYLTLYAFSSENWLRPEAEVTYIMKVVASYLDSKIDEFNKHNIRLRFFGDMSRLSKSLLKKIQNAQEKTKDNDALNLCVAFSYGSKQEIVAATKAIAEKVKQNIIAIEDIDINEISNNLYCPDVPDPDLLIRTGGDMRISNFLLWQIAYSEFYFCDKFWPEFTITDFEKAIEDFHNRERRFGARK